MDRFVNLLTDYLSVQSRRAEIVSANLANADTPGFKAGELEFAEYLREAALGAVSPRSAIDGESLERLMGVVEQEGNATGINGNNVDTLREMATLANAGGQFSFGAQMLQSRFRTLRAAIREGR
jgi:flagellar basal-body rod protein FlgB